MRRFLLLIAALFLVSISFSPFISLILSDSWRDHSYREIIMHVVSSEETKGLKSDIEVTKRLFLFTSKNTLLNPDNLLPYEEKALGYLINGLVFCDYAADILATLCAHRGIPARYCMLKDKDGVSPHTVSEVLLEGKWRVFDPAEICYYTAQSGELATLQDLSENPDLVLEHRRMQKMKEASADRYKAKSDWYRRMFPVPEEPQRSKSKVKRITPFDRIGFFYYSVFGEMFLRIYQDSYLNIKTRAMNEEEKLYYLARNYQLVHRADEAIKAYGDLLRLYPQGKYADKAALFLAFIYMDQKGDYLKTIDVLRSLVQRPELIYEKYALYYIGKCSQGLGRSQEAQKYFDQSGLFIKLDPRLAN